MSVGKYYKGYRNDNIPFRRIRMIRLNFMKSSPSKFVIEKPLSENEIKQIVSEVFPDFFKWANAKCQSLNLDTETLKDLEHNTIVFAYEALSKFDKKLMPTDSKLLEVALLFLKHKFNFGFADLMTDLEQRFND
jgi:hypothetical protein